MPFTIIIIVLLVAVCVVSVISIVKRASHGCCGAGGDDEKRIEKDGSEFPNCYKITIGGMTCKNCALRIENAFNRQDGFAAQVDLKSVTAVVRTKQPAAELLLRKTICDNGYTVESIEQTAP